MNIHKVLNMFAEPNRLRIVSILYEEDLAVNDIVEVLQLKQANTSRHLSKLLDEGLVCYSKSKKQVIYSLDESYRSHCKILRPVIETYRGYDTGRQDMERLKELVQSRNW